MRAQAVSIVRMPEKRSNPLSHPLFGADPATLLKVFARSGIPSAHRLECGLAFAASLAQTPFAAIEHGWTLARRGAKGVKQAPVFILGHWRSGTTHLYNVMSRAPHWGYVSPFATALPWDFLLLARALQPLLAKALPEGRYIDNVPVNPDSPQEDEIGLANMTPLSFYHALYFPRRFKEIFNAGVFFDGCSPDEIESWTRTLRYYYDKLSIGANGARLLIKNPVYTARADLLRRMWPDAKFIHIHRNPFEVFVSMRNFYEKLFAQFALEPWDHVDIDAVIVDTYLRMMKDLTRDAETMAPGQFVELSYDDLQAAPMEALQRIYSTLDLPGFAQNEARFSAYLQSVTGYRKNNFRFPDHDKERVARALAPFIERWSYAPPA